MDSFDTGLSESNTVNYKNYDFTTSAVPTPSTSYGRLGTKGVYLGDAPNRTIHMTSGTPLATNTNDTIIIGMAINMQAVGAPINEVLMYLQDGGTPQLAIRWHTDGNLRVCLGTSTTSITGAESGIGVMPVDEWGYLEIKAKINNTTGTIDVKWNGTSIISVSSVDTQNTANAYVNALQIAGGSSGWVHGIWMDDFVILNGAGSSPYNDFLGDVHIENLLPNGNGNSSQMTGSDGNSTDNYLLVDEDPALASPTEYVGSATVNDHDTYAMENLSNSNVTVYGIMTSLVSQKDDAGAKSLRAVIRTGATDYNGTTKSLGTSWAGQFDIWEQNPNTVADWTATEINGLEVGQEVLA